MTTLSQLLLGAGALALAVLRGAGRAFSGGYDFGGAFQHWGEAMNTYGRWLGRCVECDRQ